MIVVDASALVAIGDFEPDARELLTLLTASEAVMTRINYVEAGIVLIGRRRLVSPTDLDAWLALLGVAVRPVEDLAAPALQAYLTYGRGYHRARSMRRCSTRETTSRRPTSALRFSRRSRRRGAGGR
jgi:ribonuclease VapC